jgi:hypothetical protein
MKNDLIDNWCSYEAAKVNEDGLLEVMLALPGDVGPVTIEASPSQFLFHLDRESVY